MTRNTITKAKIFIGANITQTYGLYDKLSIKERTCGQGYQIQLLYNGRSYYKPADGDPGVFWYSPVTNFKTFNEAKQFARNNLKEIKAAAKQAGFKNITLKSLCIEVTFHLYKDMEAQKDYYSIEEVKKVCKNYLIIERDNGRVFSSTYSSTLWNIVTVTKEQDALLLEMFDIEKRPFRVIPSRHLSTIRVYKDHRVFFCDYDEKKKKYINSKLISNESEICHSLGYYSDIRGYNNHADATFDRILNEHDLEYSSSFSEKTYQLLKDFGIPGFYLNLTNRFERIEQVQDICRVWERNPLDTLNNSNETQICKDVTYALKDIPFNEEHSVVKFRNGYVVRFGKIVQLYERKTTNYRGKEEITFTERAPDPERDNVAEYTLVHEGYIEFARIFISNTLTTRSLSIAEEGGRKWRHDGIHLIDNLFQANPKETKIKINVEDRNRKALENLYTVHPKLKYMKKYMEKHPDVLYNSAIPFLRALFQYDMILETFIALGKDDIFWTPIKDSGGSRYYYASWRIGGSSNYAKTKEKFDMSSFIDVMALTQIPQKGDFYQRLGLTKQQFKLIFEDTKKWHEIMEVIKNIYFKLPNGTEFQVDRWGCRRVDLKLVSYEDCRLAVEIVKTSGYSSWEVSNAINQLFEYYHSYHKVYKALVLKKYQVSTLTDYLRMRKYVADHKFPDYKASIWEDFPDDNEELIRYHDRILFLYSQAEACNSTVRNLKSCVNFVDPATGQTFNETTFYLYCKEREISVNSFKALAENLDRNLSAITADTVSRSMLFTKMPESQEELEELVQKINKEKSFYYNLYNIYFNENWYTPYHSTYDEARAGEPFGVTTYKGFITLQLAAGLDTDKYDLYLRLYRKFKDNKRDFDTNKYPLRITDAETLDKLYTELATQEPEIDAIIRAREAERRRQTMKENEEKVAEAQTKYTERYKSLKSFNYKDGSDRCIVVPKNLVSLIVEGQELHHCVGSFVDAVSEGKNTIVFLRKVNDIDTPYVTISLLQKDKKTWYIDQAHTDRNGPISEEDVKFLKGWAKAKNVLEESVQLTYGAHCHN